MALLPPSWFSFFLTCLQSLGLFVVVAFPCLIQVTLGKCHFLASRPSLPLAISLLFLAQSLLIPDFPFRWLTACLELSCTRKVSVLVFYSVMGHKESQGAPCKLSPPNQAPPKVLKMRIGCLGIFVLVICILLITPPPKKKNKRRNMLSPKECKHLCQISDTYSVLEKHQRTL